jgi:hypothetical protein
MRRLLMLVVSVLASTPAIARAQFRLGARVAYAFPMGDEAKGSKLSDGVKGAVPIEVDASYDVTPNVSLGLYGSYAFARVNLEYQGQSLCSLSDVSCSGSVLRLGAQFNYLFAAFRDWEPWLGAQLGYEALSLDVDAAGTTMSGKDTGLEFLVLQWGVDYKTSPQSGIGPYMSLGFGQYSHAQGEIAGTSQSAEIKDKTVHEWVQLGLRGTFRS